MQQEPVRRRVKAADGKRRGSLKSRLFSFRKKRKKDSPQSPNTFQDAGGSGSGENLEQLLSEGETEVIVEAKGNGNGQHLVEGARGNGQHLVSDVKGNGQHVIGEGRGNGQYVIGESRGNIRQVVSLAEPPNGVDSVVQRLQPKDKTGEGTSNETDVGTCGAPSGISAASHDSSHSGASQVHSYSSASQVPSLSGASQAPVSERLRHLTTEEPVISRPVSSTPRDLHFHPQIRSTPYQSSSPGHYHSPIGHLQPGEHINNGTFSVPGTPGQTSLPSSRTIPTMSGDDNTHQASFRLPGSTIGAPGVTSYLRESTINVITPHPPSTTLQPRPSALKLTPQPAVTTNGLRPGGDFDSRKSPCESSIISSCSVSIQTPSPVSPTTALPAKDVEVTLRRRYSDHNILNPHGVERRNEQGRLLKSAIARHFRNLHCFGSQQPQPQVGFNNQAAVLSVGLDQYIKEVFLQLDHNHTGTVSRDDFETLCEVLEISKTPPQSQRNSGIEWLSSYKPRPNSPVNPLKLDKLSEARYKHPGPKPPVREPPSFLWTIGPRPFWELWPQKKRRKKHLSLEEFTRCLLEQWAKTHGYPLSSLKDQVWTNLTEQIKSLETSSSSDQKGSPEPPILTTETTRAQRLIRSVVRVTRRYHVLDRIARRLRRLSREEQEQEQDGSPPACHVNANGETHTTQTRRHPTPPRLNKAHKLEKQVLHQQAEICSLREVIEDLRGSLQLSDAQNLALQVLLRKMTKAEMALPKTQTSEFRSTVEESEKQLENLVKELKEMSQTKYPTMSSNIYAGSSCSFNGTCPQDIGIEEDLTQTVDALNNAHRDLGSAQRELRNTAAKLRVNGENGENGTADLNEAHKALEKAQDEIQQLRSNLEEAQAAMELTRSELNQTNEELMRTQNTFLTTSFKLTEADKRVSQLSQNRRSLLLELQSTKEVLLSSLNKVQELEFESKKVPALENKIQDLERKLANKRMFDHRHLVPRPLSTIDSGLYSTSESDQEESPSKPQDRSIEAGSDEDVVYTPRDSTNTTPEHSLPGLPPRPPSSRSRDKSPRSATPSSEKSPRSATPSSGHHSAGSKLSNTSSAISKSPADKTDAGETVVAKLRREIEILKKKFSHSEREWKEERNCLLDELMRRREDYEEMSSDFQVMEAERVRLSLLEEKIKEVLAMLRALNAMKISQRILGRLVLDAVERSVDPVSDEVQVFKFLNYLYHSTRDYERLAADNMLTLALQAVDDTEETDLEEAERAADRFPGIGRMVRDRYASHSRGMERNSGLNRTGRKEDDKENPFRIDV